MSFTLSIIDQLVKTGKGLGFEGQALQEFVKQQQETERRERHAIRKLEKERIAQAERDREIEKEKIAQAEKDREIELARIAAEKEKIVHAEKDTEIDDMIQQQRL